MKEYNVDGFQLRCYFFDNKVILIVYEQKKHSTRLKSSLCWIRMRTGLFGITNQIRDSQNALAGQL
jgi:hypothetical protein